ncbi:MAG: FeoB-associated Cys-rich membrane protein [Bacteroidaceae bacterium]
MDALRHRIPVCDGMGGVIPYHACPMNIQSIILLSVVLIVALLVLRYHLRRRKETGGCGYPGSSCQGCSLSQSCHAKAHSNHKAHGTKSI